MALSASILALSNHSFGVISSDVGRSFAAEVSSERVSLEKEGVGGKRDMVKRFMSEVRLKAVYTGYRSSIASYPEPRFQVVDVLYCKEEIPLSMQQRVSPEMNRAYGISDEEEESR
jgi:hypothetical protein